MKVRMTETLEICLDREVWVCNRCDHTLGSAHENYKHHCLVAEVPMVEAHPPKIDDRVYSFTPDKDYCRLLEFYCPHCAVVIENEYLPPGHPISNDIEIDIAQMKARYEGESNG